MVAIIAIRAPRSMASMKSYDCTITAESKDKKRCDISTNTNAGLSFHFAPRSPPSFFVYTSYPTDECSCSYQSTRYIIPCFLTQHFSLLPSCLAKQTSTMVKTPTNSGPLDGLGLSPNDYCYKSPGTAFSPSRSCPVGNLSLSGRKHTSCSSGTQSNASLSCASN